MSRMSINLFRIIVTWRIKSSVANACSSYDGRDINLPQLSEKCCQPVVYTCVHRLEKPLSFLDELGVGEGRLMVLSKFESFFSLLAVEAAADCFL